MVSSSDKKFASAIGAKTARACDSCVRKRARWYCAADDAFLCQSCDYSVHSANPLARRHERIRLKGSSTARTPQDGSPSLESLVGSWPNGFPKKARTPRHRKHINPNPHHLVPEMFGDENSYDETEEQLLYLVPEVDHHHDCHYEQPHGVIPSQDELEEFAADVESLLGKGLDEEPFDMEGLGLLSNFDGKVKNETGGEGGVVRNCDEFCDDKLDMEFATNFQQSDEFGTRNEEKKRMFLKLDYEGVINDWADQRSPWTNGQRPDLDSDDCCWPEFMEGFATVNPYGEMTGHYSSAIMVDRGREARVSRYREKRRKRLFSKKIRYEVRKLNAEKRPRMKGRFVKRTNPLPYPLLTN